MKIINKHTKAIIDSGLDDLNAHLLINEYQNDDYVIVADTIEEDKMVTKCYCGHTSYCDCGPLPEEDEVDDNGFPSMDGGRPSSLDAHSSEILKSNPIKK